jgi:hypothetical protein
MYGKYKNQRALMASQAAERKVTAVYGDLTSAGSLSILEFDRKARIQRGVKAALKMLLAAALCVFIPGAHFVLVPLCVLLAPIIGVIVGRMHSRITGANITCPHCNTPLKILSSQAKMPLIENCVSCSRPIRISFVA